VDRYIIKYKATHHPPPSVTSLLAVAAAYSSRISNFSQIQKTLPVLNLAIKVR
jgi:hypothetical protein